MDKYVKPSVTVDSVIFRYYEGKSSNLTYQAKKPSLHGEIPPSVVASFRSKKISNLAVCREVQEETSIKLNPNHIEQLITVGNTLSGSSNVDHYSGLPLLHDLQ